MGGFQPRLHPRFGATGHVVGLDPAVAVEVGRPLAAGPGARLVVLSTVTAGSAIGSVTGADMRYLRPVQ